MYLPQLSLHLISLARLWNTRRARSEGRERRSTNYNHLYTPPKERKSKSCKGCRESELCLSNKSKLFSKAFNFISEVLLSRESFVFNSKKISYALKFVKSKLILSIKHPLVIRWDIHVVLIALDEHGATTLRWKPSVAQVFSNDKAVLISLDISYCLWILNQLNWLLNEPITTFRWSIQRNILIVDLPWWIRSVFIVHLSW